MKLSDFDYYLPSDRIAAHPLERRDQSRLMRINRSSGVISHHSFADLPDLLDSSDLLVVNNTKVLPARLLGKRLGLTSEIQGKVRMPSAEIEVLLLKPLGEDTWEALVRPGRKMRVGERVRFGTGELECEVLERGDFGIRKVKFSYRGDFDQILDQIGHVPLPPYIGRPDEPQDKFQYQTVYASQPGAVAAPTAGLHFTGEVFDRLRKKGIEWCETTLHVGLGTFQPVHVDDIKEHRLEKERFQISAEAAEGIRAAKFHRRRVIAVGTTVTRTLEEVAQKNNGEILPDTGETGLFIYPGFTFRCVDGLLTNFHLPESTLLMLVSAFAGYELIRTAYQQAIAEGYRFYSYGDCMLIL